MSNTQEYKLKQYIIFTEQIEFLVITFAIIIYRYTLFNLFLISGKYYLCMDISKITEKFSKYAFKFTVSCIYFVL